MSEQSLSITQESQTHLFIKVENPEKNEELRILNGKISLEPNNVDLLMEKALIEVGMWDYQSAIDTYSKAISIDPQRAILYRWRGHRMINVRMVPEGVADLTLSAKLDPTNWETWYHLGLGHYLLRNYQSAEHAYLKCMENAPTIGDKVAVADWSWRNYMRMGKKEKASEVIEFINQDMDYGENYAYHRCLLMYKNVLDSEIILDKEKETDVNKVTIGYGLGNYYYVNGKKELAIEVWRDVLKESYWPAFGFIASEFELMKK